MSVWMILAAIAVLGFGGGYRGLYRRAFGQPTFECADDPAFFKRGAVDFGLEDAIDLIVAMTFGTQCVQCKKPSPPKGLVYSPPIAHHRHHVEAMGIVLHLS